MPVLRTSILISNFLNHDLTVMATFITALRASSLGRYRSPLPV